MSGGEEHAQRAEALRPVALRVADQLPQYGPAALMPLIPVREAPERVKAQRGERKRPILSLRNAFFAQMRRIPQSLRGRSSRREVRRVEIGIIQLGLLRFTQRSRPVPKER